MPPGAETEESAAIGSAFWRPPLMTLTVEFLNSELKFASAKLSTNFVLFLPFGKKRNKSILLKITIL